jgi:hypothetical protein
MNNFNHELVKIALQTIENIDDKNALQEIYRACGRRFAQISYETVRPKEISTLV